MDERIREWRGRAHWLPAKKRVTINQTRWVDEFGEAHQSRGRAVTVHRPHILILGGVIDHVSQTHSGDIPRDSIEGWWRELADEGLLPEWNREYYLACRKVLEKLGWLKIKHDYHRGQSKQGWLRFEPELVGSRWQYPKTKKTTSLYKGYDATASQNLHFCTLDGTEVPPRPPP